MKRHLVITLLCLQKREWIKMVGSCSFLFLSVEGKDWRQPVTQYYITAFFKIFGPSVFNLRFTSVIITLVSAVLLLILAIKLLNFKWAILSIFIFLTTPLVMIQSHMGLDNIMHIPFTILWLWGIFLFSKTRKRRYLVFAAISLGINFYTYKACELLCRFGFC